MATSLLQFGGQIDRRRGVGLLFFLVKKGKYWEKYNGPEAYEPNPMGTTFCDYAEEIELTSPSGEKSMQPQLYRVWRKPAGTWGCWVVFRYLGEEHAPDLSTPISTLVLPRGAEKLTPEECAEFWFS